MKNRILLLGAILMSVSTQSSIATRQIADKVVIGNETFGWRDSDLSSVAEAKKIKFRWPSTACHRGYVATWKIKDNSLFLTALEAWTTDPESGDITDLPIKALFPSGLPVKAQWYSGEMHLLREAKILGDNDVGGHLVECKYVSFSIKEGEITKSEEKIDYFNISIHEHQMRFIKLFKFMPEVSDFKRKP